MIEEEARPTGGRRAAAGVGPTRGEPGPAGKVGVGGEQSRDGAVAVSFTEEMQGHVTFGEEDFDRGSAPRARAGRR